jgi:hypothetical protein
MNNERLFNVVILELSAKKLKIEDDLERTLANSNTIDHKSSEIQRLVKELIEVENSINRFQEMISTNNNNQE